MRRMLLGSAAFILLANFGAGCGGQQPAASQAEKQAFVRQLIGYCADADRRLTGVDDKVRPGLFATSLARFVRQARSQPAPAVDQAQFKLLLAEMHGSSQHYRAAQTALGAGDPSAFHAALAQAQRKFHRADAAAQKYGMPPLLTCPGRDSTTPPPASGPSTTAPAQAWEPRQASLKAVQQVGAAVLDGEIWVAGGLTTSAASARSTRTTQIYDPTKNTWRVGPSLPQAVDHANLVTYHGQVWLIGGFRSQGGESVASSQVLIYDDSIGHWQPGPSLRHPRAAAAAAVVGDKLVVVGGRTGSEQLVHQTEVFDGTAWHDGARILVPGDHLAAASDGSSLYAVGGRRFDSDHNTRAVQRYEPATDRWTRLTNLPRRVSGAGAAVVNGQLLVAGGENTALKVASTVRAYDLTAPATAWTTLPSLAVARHGLAVTALGNTLYAIGGSTQPGHTASTDTVEALDVPARPTAPAQAWEPRQASLKAVQQVGAAVLDGEIWVAGGLTTSAASARSTRTTQIYDPTKNTWRVGPSLPQAVDHANLVTYHGQVWLIGGFRSQGGESVASSQVLIYDDSIGHWQPGPSLRHPRAAAAAAVVGDKLVVVGGRTGSEQLVHQTEVFDGTAWHDGARILVPGDHLAAASDGSSLYAVGGRRFDSDHNTRAVQRYEPATDRWTRLTNLPRRVSGAGAAVVNGQLLVAGGENTALKVASTVRAYDLTAPAAAWTTLPSLAVARHGLAVTALGNTLYAIGGSTQPGHTASTDTVEALPFS